MLPTTKEKGKVRRTLIYWAGVFIVLSIHFCFKKQQQLFILTFHRAGNNPFWFPLSFWPLWYKTAILLFLAYYFRLTEIAKYSNAMLLAFAFFFRQLTKPWSSMLLQLRQVYCLLNTTHPSDKERYRWSHFTFCQDIHMSCPRLSTRDWSFVSLDRGDRLKDWKQPAAVTLPAATGSLLQKDWAEKFLAWQ